MTPIDILLRHGPMPASQIAYRLQRPLTDVYGDLIHAEAQGLAEVRCLERENQSHGRVWATTPDAVPDHELPAALRGDALRVFG